MSSKIAWIALFVTLVFWLGQAGGCASNGGADEQNYKLLEEDRPMFSPEPNSGPGAAAPAAGESADVVQTEAGPVESETQPSVISLDRSNWTSVQVSPEPGVTHHWPHYFEDVEFRRHSVVDVTADPELALHQALSEADNAYTWDDAAEVFVEPLKFAFDIVALPVYMVITPPWTDATTP